MRKLLLGAAIAASLTIVYSCDENAMTGDSETQELDVTTSIVVASRSVTGQPINSFAPGDEIGLYVSSGAVNDAYNGITANKNVKSTYTTSWSQATPVYLSSAPATIYAYYPYSFVAIDGNNIPIEHTSQTDYLYATKIENIYNRSPRVDIVMNHALSLVEFNFLKENYTGIGNLTAIRIANRVGSDLLRSQATLNLSDGSIATNPSTTEPVVKATNIPQVIGSWTSTSYPKMLVMPVTTGVSGDIIVSFTVDGQVYDWNVPANTSWEQGKRNTYTVTIKGTALEVSPVTITAWGTGTAESGSIQ